MMNCRHFQVMGARVFSWADVEMLEFTPGRKALDPTCLREALGSTRLLNSPSLGFIKRGSAATDKRFKECAATLPRTRSPPAILLSLCASGSSFQCSLEHRALCCS